MIPCISFHGQTQGQTFSHEFAGGRCQLLLVLKSILGRSAHDNTYDSHLTLVFTLEKG